MVEAKVLFEYTAEQEDELSLNVGEIVKNIDCQNGGWWEGEVNGKRGMFPENFVEISKGETSADPPSKSKEKGGKVKKAKVTCDYEAEQSDELTLRIGDIIEVTSDDEDGWWDGILNGKTGTFPSNFVEVIECDDGSSTERRPRLPSESKRPPAPKPHDAHDEDAGDATDRGAKAPEEAEKPKMAGVGFGGLFSAADLQKKLRPVSMQEEASKKPAPKGPPVKNPAPLTPVGKKSAPTEPAKTKKTAPALPPEPVLPSPSSSVPGKDKAKVVFAYEPQNSDELELNIGDVIVITDKAVCDGWWEGEFKGKTGVFPNNFVELLSNEEPGRPPALPPAAGSAKAAAPHPAAGPKRPLLPPPGKSLSGDIAASSTPSEPPSGRPPPPDIKRTDVKRPSPPLPSAKPPKPVAAAKPGKTADKPHVPPSDTKDTPATRASSFGSKSGPPQPPKPVGLKKQSVDEGLGERSATFSEGKRLTNGERKKNDIDFDAVSPSDVLQNVNKSRVKGPTKNLPTKKGTLPRVDSTDKTDGKVDGKPHGTNEGHPKDKSRSTSTSSHDGKPLLADGAGADAKALGELKKEVSGMNEKMAAVEKRLLKHIKTLTDDLDAERMERMKQQVEIDRLRKQLSLLEQ